MSSISKKRKFIADGLFYAELNELLTRELAEDGYAGVEVRVTPLRTEVIIRATRTQNVLGEKGQRIRELTSVVQKRFKFQDGAVELYAERVANRGLCSQAQAESLKHARPRGYVSDGSRRRRGRDVDIPRGEESPTRPFRGDESRRHRGRDVDIPRDSRHRRG